MKFKAHKFCSFLAKASVKCRNLRNLTPMFENQVKKQIFEKAAYIHRKQNGIIRISKVMFSDVDHKLAELKLKKNDFELKTRPYFYDYLADGTKEEETVWYVNFASEELFGYYDGNGFSQDEIQAVEMPLLVSVRIYLESLKDEGFSTRTVEKVFSEESGKRVLKPTPFLFENVPLWVCVNTSPKLKDGTQASIYGWKFAGASKEAIEAGISLVSQDFKLNVISISAPAGGRDFYKEAEIQQIVESLVSSFSAAVKQTREQKKKKCIIHSGNWGTGSGGNYELIYLCQIYAASVCGVDHLILHDCKTQILQSVLKKYEEINEEGSLIEFMEAVRSFGFMWN